MKRDTKGKRRGLLSVIGLAVVCMLMVKVYFGESRPLPGKLFYVYSYGETADSWKWRLMEREIVSGAERVISESDSERFLINGRDGGMYYAESDANQYLVIRDIETGEEAWRGDASAVGSDWNECFAIDSDYLYYTEYAGRWHQGTVFVKRIDRNGKIETLAGIEEDDKRWLSCFSMSQHGEIAYMKEIRLEGTDGGRSLHSYICVWADGEERMIAEGKYPWWNGENEICFADDDALVAYRLNTAEIREVRAQNGERIKLDSESLLSSPNPACSGGYLVYVIDRTGTTSMPNKPDVGIISLKDGKTFRISKVNMDQFGNGKVFVSLDAAQ